MNKKYAVLYVDCGENSNYRPRLGGVFRTKECAKEWIKKDMDIYSRMGYECDYRKMEAILEDNTFCLWNIEEMKGL